MEKRNFSLDLLKIISMMMIIMSHVLNLSGTLSSITVFSPEYYITQFLSAVAYCFTNCFAMISGYFLYNRDFSFKRMLRIYCVVVFYTWVFSLALIMIGKLELSSINILKVLLPISTTQYWYITAYMGLCCVYPFINILLNSIDKKQHFFLILLLSILFVFNPGSIVGFSDPFYVNNGYNWLWFIFLYLIATYIRRSERVLNVYKLTFLFILSVITISGSRYLVAFTTKSVLGRIVGSGFLYRYNSFPALVGTVSLFLIFLNLNVNKGRKLINALSPLMLGVYLIHMQFGIKEQLHIILNSFFVYKGFMLFSNILYSVLMIFGICCLIEKLRQVFFEKLGFNRIIDRFGTTIDKRIALCFFDKGENC